MAIALDARDRAADARRSNPSVMASDALVSIVMAAAATEAFINELGAYYEMTFSLVEPRETASGVALAEVERSRGSTEPKYLVASLVLSGQMFDRGSQPFQDLSTLMRVRNDLMHPRPLDRLDDDAEAPPYVAVPPSYVREFERRGMAYTREADVSVSWLNLLETEQVASWACQAAVEIIVAVVEMTPPNGGFAKFGRSFSEHYRPGLMSWCRLPPRLLPVAALRRASELAGSGHERLVPSDPSNGPTRCARCRRRRPRSPGARSSRAARRV